MLLAIRERIMGIVGWVILGILFIAFAFFGLNSYLQSSAENYAVSVNDVEIPVAQHQRAYQQIRARMQDMMGSNYNSTMLDEEVLKKTALQQLIRDELVLQETDTEGFSSSRQQVAARIAAVDAFKEDNAFSKARYERVLGLQGMSPAEFEWRLGRELVTTQFRDGIIKTAAVTTRDLDEAFKIEGQQRRFRYVVLSGESLTDQITLEDNEIEAYFTEHASEFMTPEQVRLQYLELDAATLDPAVEVDDEAIQALYTEKSEQFVTEEQRHARHILVRLPPDADDEAINVARNKAESLQQRLSDGESFEKLAKEESDDPGSASAGGDLGTFGRGLMVPEVDEAVFAMQVGERSEPVKSPFGFHIIELVEIQAEHATPIEEVRAELAEQILAEARSELFYELSELLTDTTYEQPDSLAGAAEALDLEIMETDWVSRSGGEGIVANETVVEVAFSEDVRHDGNNSTPIEIGENHVVVVRLLEHKDPAPQSIDDVREQIQQQLEHEKLQQLAGERGKALLASLNEGVSLDDIAKQHKLEVSDSGLINRNNRNIAPALVQAAFSLQAPVDGGTVYGEYLRSNGDFAILALGTVKQGDFSSLNETNQSQTRNNLARVLGSMEMAAVMDVLNERAVIKIPDQGSP